MCMRILIGSPKPIPLTPWSRDAEARDLYVRLLDSSDPNVTVLVARFSLPNVYDVLPYNGDGCNFRYDLDDLHEEYEWEPDEAKRKRHKDRARRDYESGRHSVSALGALFTDALQNCSNRSEYGELYAVWYGNENLPDLPPRDVTPPVFGGDGFAFTENQLWRVRRASDSA